MKIRLLCNALHIAVAVIAMFLLLPGEVSAATATPHGWPWRGVVLEGVATPEDIKKLAGGGANSVAILLSPRTWAIRQKLTPQQAWQYSLNYADTILDACRSYGMTGILSISQIPTDPASGLGQESREFWENPAKLQEANNIASSLAQHFHTRGKELAAYEILNEPLIREGSKVEKPKAWHGLVQTMVKEIRQFDPNRFIVVTLSMGGMPSGYTDAQPLSDKHIVYGAHMYMPHAYTHQGVGDWQKRDITYPGIINLRYWDVDTLENAMSPLISFQEKYHVPVWIGEFSALRWAPNSNQYLSDLIDVFEKYGWSWSYFSYNGFHGWNPSCDEVFNSDNCPGDNTPRWQLLKRKFLKSPPGTKVPASRG